MKRFTTAKAALAFYLLQGKTINVKNCFTLFGLTNAAREIPRMIEIPFGLSVTRQEKEGKSRFSQRVTWVDYSLNKARQDPKSIEKLQNYITKHTVK